MFPRYSCSLEALLTTSKPTPDRVVTMATELLKAVNFLHNRGVIHRDIKPANVFVGEHLVLGDLGSATKLYGGVDKFDPVVTTWCYRAPEVFLFPGEQTFALDLWSTGVVLAEMVLSKPFLVAPSESEQLVLLFREFGVPSEATWPGVSRSRVFRNVLGTFGGDLKTQPQRLKRLQPFSDCVRVVSVVNTLLKMYPPSRYDSSRCLNMLQQ